MAESVAVPAAAVARRRGARGKVAQRQASCARGQAPQFGALRRRRLPRAGYLVEPPPRLARRGLGNLSQQIKALPETVDHCHQALIQHRYDRFSQRLGRSSIVGLGHTSSNTRQGVGVPTQRDGIA
jgi:hypothetical protein